MEIKQASDQELAFLVKENADSNALQELITRHSGIYMDMLKSYGAGNFNQNQLSEFIEQKDFVIYEAATEFDPERSKFSTFLANKTKYMCLSEKTRFQKNSKIVSLDDVECYQKDTRPSPDEDYIYKDSMHKIMDMIKNHKDKRVEKIFQLRYFGNKAKKVLPWKEVAAQVGLSAPSCINIHDKTLELFKTRIKNEQTIEF